MDIFFDQKFKVSGEELPVKLKFKDTIFVLEDIDAASKIVHKRSLGKVKKKFHPTTIVKTTTTIETPPPDENSEVVLTSPPPSLSRGTTVEEVITTTKQCCDDNATSSPLPEFTWGGLKGRVEAGALPPHPRFGPPRGCAS